MSGLKRLEPPISKMWKSGKKVNGMSYGAINVMNAMRNREKEFIKQGRREGLKLGKEIGYKRALHEVLKEIDVLAVEAYNYYPYEFDEKELRKKLEKKLKELK